MSVEIRSAVSSDRNAYREDLNEQSSLLIYTFTGENGNETQNRLQRFLFNCNSVRFRHAQLHQLRSPASHIHTPAAIL